MLFGFDENKQLVKAATTQKEQAIFCPDCGERLICKVGTIKIPHFSHYKNSQCCSFSEGESAEHLAFKEGFYKWGKAFAEDWEMEAILPEISQRPDLLSQKLVIEVQCSPLKISRFIERITGYHKHQYEDWWLLGPKLAPKKKLTQLQKAFCNFSTDKGLHLWLVNQQGIFLYYFLREINGTLFADRHHWIPYAVSLKEIYQTNFQDKQPLIHLEKNHGTAWKKQLNQQLVKKDPNILRLQNYFYQAKAHVLYLPEWFYLPSWYLIFYQADILLFRYLTQEKREYSVVMERFQNYLIDEQIIWGFPRIEQQEILDRLWQETNYLLEKSEKSI